MGNGDKYLKRFLCALPAAAAAVLTVLLFGPMEIILSNRSSLVFDPFRLVLPVALVSLSCILVGAALLAAFRGKAYRFMLTLCLAGALCVYIQNTFLNTGLPELSGDTISWDSLRGKVIFNAVIWAVIFCLPFVLLRFKTIWRTAVALLPVMICIMQLSGFVYVAISSSDNEGRDGYLGYDQFWEYSADENVLVFMLDRLDYEYLARVLEYDPAFLDRLDGFVQYDNAISEFTQTKPALNYMLTGYDKTLFKEDMFDCFLKSWDDGDRHILKDLNAADYTIDLYAVPNISLGKHFQSFKPYIANLEAENATIIWKELANRYLQIGIYRGSPLFLKRRSTLYTDKINDIFDPYTVYTTDETLYDAGIQTMTAEAGKRYFKFYEFYGSHQPYHMLPDGTLTSKDTNVTAQTMGSFEILFRAFDRMKALGIYKDASIIITADHGFKQDKTRPLEYPTRIGLFYKSAGSEGTPLQHTYAPVSLRNISPTILKAAGLDYSAYGVPLDEVPDDPSIVRHYHRTIKDVDDLSGNGVIVLHYDVSYDASKMESWTLIHSEKLPKNFGL